MESKSPTPHRCPTCGAEYRTQWLADKCQSRPVLHDRGVRVGDWVRVKTGKHKGLVARVEGVRIVTGGFTWWMWGRYWHTVALDVLIRIQQGKRGERTNGVPDVLMFDEYEVVRR
jgi:hypothetical protein